MNSVTVVIPSRNRSDLLSKSINSIKSELAISIIISDNHSDPPISIKKEYTKIIKPYKYLNIVDHFNWCLKLVDNGYIMIFSDDDILSPDYIDFLRSSLESNPSADLAIGNIARLSHTGEIRYYYDQQKKYKVQSTIDWSLEKRAIHYLKYGHKEEWAWAIIYGLYKATALNQCQFSDKLKDPGALFVCEIMLNHDIAYGPSSGTIFKRDGGESNIPAKLPISSIITTPWQTLKSTWLISETILKKLSKYNAITFKVLSALLLFWGRNISKSLILMIWCTIRSITPASWLSNIRPKLRRLMGH